MSNVRLPQRRRLLIGLAAVGLVPLAGCMTKPMRPVNADGTYCHRIGKSYRPKLTCTPEPIPPASVDAEAKRFESPSGILTVYVLRRSWADASVVVPVTVDRAAGAATIPDSLVRLRLAPGRHILSAKWDGRSAEIDVDGRGGEVRVVELKGSGWAWGDTFSWRAVRLEDVRERANATKLVADVRLFG